MEKIYELAQDIESFVSHIRPVVEHASKAAWSEAQGTLTLMRRGVLRRQFDCLEAILLLVRANRGYAGVPLLRPACEEWIWVKYLNSMTEEEGEELFRCKAQREVQQALSAQNDYIGSAAMHDLGLDPYLTASQAQKTKTDASLQALGRKLSWNSSSIRDAAFPSVAFVARKAGLEREYRYLYHATSRYVHFSAAELLRRSWGKPGEVTILSDNFNQYWSAFALKWGYRIFTQTYLELNEKLTSDGVMDPDLQDAEGEAVVLLMKKIAEYGEVPIITAAELSWESESPT